MVPLRVVLHDPELSFAQLGQGGLGFPMRHAVDAELRGARGSVSVIGTKVASEATGGVIVRVTLGIGGVGTGGSSLNSNVSRGSGDRNSTLPYPRL